MGREPAVQQNQTSACMVAILNIGGNSGAVNQAGAFTLNITRIGVTIKYSLSRVYGTKVDLCV